MIKKVVLLFALILYFVFGQNTVFAQGKSTRDAYLDRLQEKIESNWLIPTKSNGKSAVVSFVISRDGSISNVEIVRSSNDNEKNLRSSSGDEFDKSAVNAIYKLSSFEPLTGSDYTLSVQFFFSPIFTSIANVNGGRQLTNTDPQRAFVNVANIPQYVDFPTYINDLQNKINSNWNPKSLKKHRNATISLRVDKDGTVEKIIIQKSSNKKKFDNEITDSVLKSFPLDHLPSGVQSEYKNIQIDFVYEKTKDKNVPIKYTVAHINDKDGYEKYINQVETIMSKQLNGKRYFFKKDILVEMNIEKDGKLKYVKLQNPSVKDGFIRKEFNRKILVTLPKTSFPPIPNEMGLNDITLDYRILTQRKRLFMNFINDYVLYGFTTGVGGYCVQDSGNL